MPLIEDSMSLAPRPDVAVAIVIVDNSRLNEVLLKWSSDERLKYSWDGRPVGHEACFGFPNCAYRISESELVLESALASGLAAVRQED